MPVKITAIKCPSCRGTGKFNAEGFSCMWCGGAKRLSRAAALRYAAQSFGLAQGGYICGDLDWDTRCEMIAYSDAIRRLLREPPLHPEYARK